LQFKVSGSDYHLAIGDLNDFPFVLIKPVTYVNLSGRAATDVLGRFNVKVEDMLVLHDDVNLETARLRLKLNGGDGGHNGLSSIIYNINSDKFPRLRFGIGRNFEQGEMAEYVLSPFAGEEIPLLEESIKFSCCLVEEFIKGGLKASLDLYSKTFTRKKPLDDDSDNSLSKQDGEPV